MYSETTAELFWQLSTMGTVPDAYEIWQVDRRCASWPNSAYRLATVTGTSYFIDNLKPNTAYLYYVVARDDNGNRSRQNDIKVVTPFQLQPPRNLRASIYGPRLLELFWDRDADGYVQIRYWKVYRDGKLVAGVGGNSWIDETLEPGISYQYHVIAVLTNQDSAPSKFITVSTQPWLR